MMKRCPKCGQTFADQNLNFCLNDGELLMYQQEDSRPFSDEPPPTKLADDSPPTLMMNSPRDTNPVGWPQSSPPVQWQGQQQIVTPPGHFPVQYAGLVSPNQTLPIIALCLGVASFVFVCCYGGLWLGIPAAIVGFIGLRNADREPSRYGGRGLAIAGMIVGLITFVLSLILLFFGVLGQIT
jgi:hypothetical protein